jgi:hypothetical protein
MKQFLLITAAFFSFIAACNAQGNTGGNAALGNTHTYHD